MQQSIESYRALFPVTRQYTYLNHAACAAMPQPGLDAITRYWQEQSARGTLSEPAYFPVADVARTKIARLAGADRSEIGWVQNTSTAIGLVANGLEWREGDNVVTVQGEFPANVYPWLGLQRFGVETRLVPQRDSRVLIDDIAAAMDSRTRLLSISFVEFSTGFRNDLAALAQLCHERGTLLNVDAIQGLGALKIDVHDLGIDFMGAGTHKWLLGPQGLGILYVRRDLLDTLWPLSANWHSVPDPYNHLVDYGQPWVDSAARFEGSTWNISAIVAFDAVLDLILEVGPDKIEKRVLALTAHLVDGLQARGCRIISSLQPGERSGIVCFTANGDPVALLERARSENIVVALRAGRVRVSPHFYNTEEEIDRFLELVAGSQ